MDQSAKYAIKSLTLVPVMVAITATLVTAPIVLTGANNNRQNPAGFFLALAAGLGLSYVGIGILAPHISKLAGDPGPITPAPKGTKWHPLDSKKRPIYYRY